MKSIRQVELHVSNDGGQVWQLAKVVPPTSDTFIYTAPSDGRYWFHIVTEDLKGNKDPANLTTEPPAMKVLFDTKAPTVAFTNVKRTADEATVEWRIEDQFPNEMATRFYFRGECLRYRLARGNRTGRVAQRRPLPRECHWTDHRPSGRCGHGWQHGRRDEGDSTGKPAGHANNDEPVADDAERSAAGEHRDSGERYHSAAGFRSAWRSHRTGRSGRAGGPTRRHFDGSDDSHSACRPSSLHTASRRGRSRDPAGGRHDSTGFRGTDDTIDHRADSHFRSAHVGRTGQRQHDERTGDRNEPAPGYQRPAFDLNYQVEQCGSSGISRVDLWVTHDDGRSWVWWSQHDGRESPVKVNLGTTSNQHQEGLYGFRLVPVSGAGLSDATPTAGDAPDMRIIVDITAPAVKIFPAVADPNDPNALMLQWEAMDKNFGDDPITIEWCETATGPWRPVATAVVSDSPSGLGILTKRLSNTGKYSWHVPNGLPPRVYLKVTAKDAAGNTTEQVTREPILIDLTKPRAKITGIGAGPMSVTIPGGPAFGPVVKP